ncbi:MAG TPA: TIGR03560 family F420-dependent LLM class oxidoreductase [candidate division Zixibacteria bacterium]|nr:TIGR03560 family F420-dependent LLM class oxidoreductase [candidate division Zixibacteria bacterium]
MKIGVIVPQGWTGEYDGWEPQRAWARTVAVAHRAERLGFESIWLFDHFHTVPRPTDEITFESFTALSALVAETKHVRLGHIVLCNGYRNPALTAKMAGTLDVISGGRFELGVGAGWKRDEFEAYGYGFPGTRERLAALRDGLEIISRMLTGGPHDHATYEGEHARVRDAINWPKGLQSPRIPIMVGGNGPNVTWRLAARYADELNLDGLSPEQVREALPTIRARCEEIGRDPETLRLSVHAWWGDDDWSTPGDRRMAYLMQMAELGVDRVIGLLQASATSDEALIALAEDARAAGAELSVQVAGPA